MDSPTATDLELREATVTLVEGADGGGPVAPDGTVLLHIIRPGVGRGKGRHLYEARMLQANAHKFTGWKMYVNHLSPEAKRAMGGLPRDVRDLGGRIVESWWDPTIPAVSGRFGQGAVVGRAKPTPQIRELIENDPEIVEASISATATGVKPGSDDKGQRVWIVEGIEDKGSVDWVTEAGAGGRVVSLMEAAMESDTDGTLALLASMSDEEFRTYIQKERPEIVEALSQSPSGHTGDTEDEMTKLTPEMLAEALADDSGRRTLIEALTADEDTRDALLEALDVDSYVAGLVHSVLTEHLPQLVEAAVEAERDVIRATAKADADRRLQVERFERTAHQMVESARLPDPLKEQIKAKFSIQESGDPSPALDVIDKLDADGKVEKKADAVLTEAVEAEITSARALAASLRPARVSGQGPSAATKDGDGTIQEGKQQQPPATAALLQESGFGDVDPWTIDSPKALQG